MWRTNTNTNEGETARTASQLFFSTGLCDNETEACRDIFFEEKYVELHHRAEQEACRDFVPMLGQSTRTAIYFGAPGARQARQVLFDARPSTSASSFTRTKCLDSDSDVVRVLVHRQTKRAP